jgi:hypothetical protein
MTDRDNKLDDIRSEIKSLSESLLWCEKDIADLLDYKIHDDSEKSIDLGISLDAILRNSEAQRDVLSNLELIISRGFDSVQNDLSSVSSRSVVQDTTGVYVEKEEIAESVSEATRDAITPMTESIVQSNDRAIVQQERLNESTVDSIRRDDFTQKMADVLDQIIEPIEDLSESIDSEKSSNEILDLKNLLGEFYEDTIEDNDEDKGVEEVLASAASFLKNWGSPVQVGVALTIPIVGAIGALGAGLYFIIGKIADTAVVMQDEFKEFSTALIRGGLVGLIKGQENFSYSSSAASPENDNGLVLVQIRDSLVSGGTMAIEAIRELSTTTSSIGDKITEIQVDKIAVAVDSLGEKLDRLKVPDELLRDTQTVDSIEPITIDYSYQERILSVISSPIDVRIVESNPRVENEAKGTEKIDVFAAAVRPLVDGQIALQNMLDSNFRRLNDAVVSLSQAPRREDVERTTKITDTLNSDESNDTEELLLSETVLIRMAVESISTQFAGFREAWDSRKIESGASSDPSTQVSMN